LNRYAEVTVGGRVRFLKTNDDAGHADVFAAEADGLRALRAAGCAAPEPVSVRETEWDNYLLMEHLDLRPHGDFAALGRMLARLHRNEGARFGWARDNYIGASPQLNGWSDEWLPFWREKRLHAQLRLAAHNRLPTRMIDRGERLAADCDAFFVSYAPAKSLLHGDLWGGNASALADGTPAVFDPAIYVGDREADIAMTELFGGFPKEFRSAYAAAWPLDTGYPIRRDFYNLYHVLNHANLFAGGYVRQAEQSIERLLAEIR